MGIAAALADLRVARSSLFAASQHKQKLIAHQNAGVTVATAQFNLANNTIAVARGDVSAKREAVRLAILSGVP